MGRRWGTLCGAALFGAVAACNNSGPVSTGSAQPIADATATSTPASTAYSAGSATTLVPAGEPTGERTTGTPATVASTPSPATSPVPNAPETFITAPNGRVALDYVSSADALAARLNEASAVFADPAAGGNAATVDGGQLADAGHAHYLAIKQLANHPEWDATVLAQLSADDADITARHLVARRALFTLGHGFDKADEIPAWNIAPPEPEAQLIAYYQDTEAETGIEWEYLAAINRIETGLGRIRGLSSVGARGPMQFLPTTWDERGIGEGDIDDPEDAIHAAGRYLVRRGGPDDMGKALYGYNPADEYVTAVSTWAGIYRDYPEHFTVMYHWPIYFTTERGDVWLPIGYRSDAPTSLDRFIADNPWSTPITDPAAQPPVSNEPNPE